MDRSTNFTHKMKVRILSGITLLTMTLFVINCEAMDSGAYSLSYQQQQTTKFSVNIVSEPSAASIEINDDLSGEVRQLKW